MKSIFLLAVVVAALSVSSQASVVQTVEDVSSRQNLNVGANGPRDQLFHRSNVYRAPIWNAQTMNVDVAAPSANMRITRIQATQVGTPQWASSVQIVGGGLNRNFVQLRFWANTNQGINYRLEVWGS